MWAFGWYVSDAQVFYFGNGKVNTCASTTSEILPISTCTLCHQKSYISKSIQPVFKIFASARRCSMWAFGWVCLWCSTLAMAMWILCPSTAFEILPLSTCSLCQQKSYISKGMSTDFRKLSRRLEDVEGGHLGVKVSGAQVFYFCNGKLGALRIENIWNFTNFNLYTVLAKILYLQRYSTDFRNLSASARGCWRWDIWVESFMCAGVLLLQ